MTFCLIAPSMELPVHMISGLLLWNEATIDIVILPTSNSQVSIIPASSSWLIVPNRNAHKVNLQYTLFSREIQFSG